MKFVSCILVAESESEEISDDIVLCESEIRQEPLPDKPEEVKRLTIDGLVVSEGNEIHRRLGLTSNDLRVFSGSDGEKSTVKEYVWYEFVKLLTGHRVQLASLNDKIKFTRWVCHAPEGGSWYLVMELVFEGIVRKIAQVELEAVSHGEVDLFQMTSILFRAYCESNDALRETECHERELEASLNNFKEEQETLEKALQERDNKTRVIVLGLLNEKKRKIQELQQELAKEHPSSKFCDVSDSEIMNKNLKDAVSQLISPGKRKRRTNDMRNDIKRKETKRKLFPEAKIESNDDFDDFQFFGITKLKDNQKTNGDGTPKKVQVKEESQGNSISETDSQRSDSMPDSKSTPDGDPHSEVNEDSTSETEAETEAEPELQHESESDTDTDA